MTEPFIGQIQPFGFGFAPRNWAMCNGQILSISQNTALFSLLGTIYGGNGKTTFALPNLQSRVPMHAGTFAGGQLSQGEAAGAEQVTLDSQHSMPLHNHAFVGASADGNAQTQPTMFGLAKSIKERRGRRTPYYAPDTTPQPLNHGLGFADRRQPAAHQHAALPDDQLVHRLAGIFPSRN